MRLETKRPLFIIAILLVIVSGIYSVKSQADSFEDTFGTKASEKCYKGVLYAAKSVDWASSMGIATPIIDKVTERPMLCDEDARAAAREHHRKMKRVLEYFHDQLPNPYQRMNIQM